METETKNNLADRTIWVRILYMLLFAIAFSIAEFLIAVSAIFQAVVVLVTGRVNDAVHRFGKNLTVYIAELTEFVTFNSEELPFPFADWPDHTPGETKWSADHLEDADSGGIDDYNASELDEVDSPDDVASTDDGPDPDEVK